MGLLEQLGVTGTLVPLGLAALLGAIVGVERQIHSQYMGMRTHIMVALGSAAFVLASAEVFGGVEPALTRVVQGIAAGIGFIGAGTILKLSHPVEVKGLTTASTVWVSSSVGIACGLQVYRVAVWTTLLALIVLSVIRPFEKGLEHRNPN